MPLTLRRAVEGDIPFLMRAERGEGYEAFVGQSEADEHRAFQSDPTRAVFIAETGGHSRGYVLVQDLDNPDGHVRIRRVVALTPDGGTGSAMVPLVIDWIFSTTGAQRVWLHTRHENARARHLYEKIGMQVEVPGSPGEPGHATQRVYAVTRAAWLPRTD